MILDGLLENQKIAVTHPEGPLLVLAGPGSGKTLVVTKRIAHLIAGGVPPGRILALTFTNKAAEEMTRRIREMVDSPDLWISTFHSCGAKMLRIDGHRIGFERNFSVADEQVSREYLKTACSAVGLNDRDFPIAQVVSAVKNYKMRGLSPEKAMEIAYDPRQRQFAQIFRAYHELLRSANTLDFDDLLCETVRLLTEQQEVLEKYRRKFLHVLVDEYQDTNLVQYNLLRLLAGENRNVCVVGDPDQSIYAWRGANLDNILNFEKDFPGAKVVRLEQNFRSTRAILRAAQEVIENNSERKEKGIKTDNAEGDPVAVLSVEDEECEGREIARLTSEARRAGFNLNDIAVFYRTNAQSRVLEESFRALNLPYNVVGSTNFYDRAEVRDLLAYLRLLENPKDIAAFDRLTGGLVRGVGAVTALRIKDFAKEKGLPVLATANSPELWPLLKEPAASHFKEFATMMERLRILKESAVPGEVVRQTLNLSGMRKRLEESTDEKASERLQNLEEMVSDAVKFGQAQPGARLADFLEKVALISDIDTWENSTDRVSLMTLHSSKGLEFPVVFIAGVEDGLLPHENSMSETRRFEEERRLFFVGMTRAKKRLIISHAQTRTIFGVTKPRKRSRFIDEMPTGELRFIDRCASQNGERDDYRRGNISGYSSYGRESSERSYARPQSTSTPSAPRTPHLPQTPAKNSSSSSSSGQVLTKNGQPIQVGSRVTHAAFGAGKVLELVGSGRDANAVIDFARVGRKTLKLAYAPLEVL